MNAVVTSLDRYQPLAQQRVFRTLSARETLRGARFPRVFAAGAATRRNQFPRTRFISSEQVTGRFWASAGFLPVEGSPGRARAQEPHAIAAAPDPAFGGPARGRFALAWTAFPSCSSSIPMTGSSQLNQLRCGLFRVRLPEMGWVVSMGRLSRYGGGDASRRCGCANVVCAAVRISERFEALGEAVERMERTVLDSEQRPRVSRARRLRRLRFPDDPGQGRMETLLRSWCLSGPRDVGNEPLAEPSTPSSRRILRGRFSRGARRPIAFNAKSADYGDSRGPAIELRNSGEDGGFGPGPLKVKNGSVLFNGEALRRLLFFGPAPSGGKAVGGRLGRAS